MKRSGDVDGWGCVGLVIAFVLLAALSTVANGFVLVKLWQWFVLPTFESAPVLSTVPAMGLGLIVAFLTYQSRPDEEKDKHQNWSGRFFIAFGTAIGKPAMYLIIGWIIYQFA